MRIGLNPLAWGRPGRANAVLLAGTGSVFSIEGLANGARVCDALSGVPRRGQVRSYDGGEVGTSLVAAGADPAATKPSK
ncbi:hypothetical protein XFF6166_440067 [Xanthomonas citri pv. fuscans]|nr:hypothetical protein XFF6166_440067 [Xanthomonas citri pv. fuscans]SON99226.1 hypothetical protein XFF6960_140066 [Xanthomonas citri pv. fuscans]SOO02896.1 hypothetical protein XFF7767_130010 [Xanthomonas citri pv. fuscans]SOO11376.1 hypothetical protein XFF6970_780023 [Xanthomonas citri pv. fuscans]SOO13418.1 hypothetical protein XFF7766_170066 [Xanthomonas citri pv. fuscans]